VAFIGSVGVILDGVFENLFSLLALSILLENVGIAEDNQFVKWIFLVGHRIVVLCLIIVHLFEFLLCGLENLLKR
jgi:hypothetical protein